LHDHVRSKEWEGSSCGKRTVKVYDCWYYSNTDFTMGARMKTRMA
jgi:hypothetical protein